MAERKKKKESMEAGAEVKRGGNGSVRWQGTLKNRRTERTEQGAGRVVHRRAAGQHGWDKSLVCLEMV